MSDGSTIKFGSSDLFEPSARPALVLDFPFQLVGTGGSATRQFFVDQVVRHYQIELHELSRESPSEVDAASTEDDLRQIRSFLKPAVSDIARAFNVSRQAIYDWQAGKPISAENRSVIRELAIACSELASRGVASSAELLRRRIKNSKNLLQLVTSGMSGQEAAKLLADILRTEERQAEALSARLGKRSNQSIDLSDAGRPGLNEES